ncbi:nuclear factor I A [Homo sapiens]|uniref:Nuclear factor I A n=1 Tax=Homo sapiens TaxID=9606 RepID=A0A590UJ67_HUMAN|nr:nuclear factor I A [Homo sapiens]KAI4080901.1 nuclear factor I A [Homo sapiens]
MKLADSVMAGKASDGSIKWQLCYDISARTWWMTPKLHRFSLNAWTQEPSSSVLPVPSTHC